MPKKNPEHDRRTKEYRRAAAERGECLLAPHVEAFMEYLYDCGYKDAPYQGDYPDYSYWVPTTEIRGVVNTQFPNAPYVDGRELGQAIAAAFPDAKRLPRTPSPGSKAVWGWAGITGPSCVRKR